MQGMRCVKYGVTRDYVLGLEGYLANVPCSMGLPLEICFGVFMDRFRRHLGIIRHLKLLPRESAGWQCTHLKMKQAVSC